MNPKWIVGKTVASVEMQPFDDGCGGKAFDPVIRFTYGSLITFFTQETDVGEYGTDIVYRKRKRPVRAERWLMALAWLVRMRARGIDVGDAALRCYVRETWPALGPDRVDAIMAKVREAKI